MALYHYIASTNNGETRRGNLAASGKVDLANKLKAMGLFLVSCRSDEDTEAAARKPSQPTPAPPPQPRPESFQPSYPPPVGNTVPQPTYQPQQAPANPAPGNYPSSASVQQAIQSFRIDPNHIPSQPDIPAVAVPMGLMDQINALFGKKRDPNLPPGGSVPLKELVVLTRQLSISINTGMSFVEALQSLVTTTRNPRLSWTLRKVLDEVLSGKRFSEALSIHPDIFKPVYISMTAAGEAGGFMPEALNRTAAFLEKEIELHSKIKSAMVYPAVIAVVASAVIIGMMAFIVPTFVKVFTDMNAQLPGPTLALIALSNFTRHGGFLTPLVLVGFAMYLKRLRKTYEPFRVFWDEKILGVPVLGKMLTLEIITRFIRTLASLVSNGVVALQAISVARQVVENRTFERVVDDIFASVQQGNGISPVLYRSKHFPVLVANMVSTGEKTGAIPEVLNKMADYYDAEVSAAVSNILTLMEPALIVVMAGIVGFVILGLMLPMFQMSSLVGN